MRASGCDYNERLCPDGLYLLTHYGSSTCHLPLTAHRRATCGSNRLEQWLAKLFGTRDFQVTTASADASFRRYFRVTRGSDSWIAMDAPPAKEDMEPYIRIAAMLVDIGVNAPRVLGATRRRAFCSTPISARRPT